MNSIVRVYEGNHFLIDGKPLVIITVRPVSEYKFRAEYFIFVGNSDHDFYDRSFSLDKYEDKDICLTINIDFVTAQALKDATKVLNDHLVNQYEKTKNANFLIQPYSLKEVELIQLFGLFQQNEYKEKLNLTYEKTRSEDLLRIIEKLWHSPKIHYDLINRE